MERIFATIFPLKNETETENVLDTIKFWINEGIRRGHRSQLPNLQRIVEEPEVEIKADDNSVQKISVGDAFVIRYSNKGTDSSDLWLTEVVMNKGLIALSLSRGSQTFSPSNSFPAKPVLVNLISEKCGGGNDGDIPFKCSPNIIEEDCIPFIADFINGDSNFMLPIVYLTRNNYTNQTIIDPEVLEKELRGVSHIFLDPEDNPSVNVELQKHLKYDSMACYGGAIKIYWPGITGFVPGSIWTSRNFESCQSDKEKAKRIFGAIAKESRGLIIPTEMSYSGLQQKLSRSKLDILKSQGNTTLEELKEEYETLLEVAESEALDYKSTIRELKASLEEARNDVNKLRYISEGYRNNNEGNGSVLLNSNSGICPNTVKETVLYCLRRVAFSCGARCSEIVESVIDADSETVERIVNDAEDQKKEIKRILLSDKFGTKQANKLKKLGFEVKRGSDHYKVSASDGIGGTATIPCTPSDHRTRENNYHQFINRFY